LYLFNLIQKNHDHHDDHETAYPLIILSIFSFFISLGIYLIFRSDDLLLVNYFLSKFETLEDLRNVLNSKIHLKQSFILYNLPDGLFLFSYNALIAFVCRDINKVYQWIFSFLLIMIFIEFLQYYDIVKGTFDFVDIISYIVFSILSVFMINLYTKKNYL
jgi:hypothetical protein